MIKPEKLKIGDTIGIIAPSRPVDKKKVLAGIKKLESRGFKVKLGKNLYKKTYYSAGTAKEKASDLNAMFKDKEVKAIICAAGGISATQIVDLIDYEIIKKNPKIFMGFSDITVLLLAIYKKTGLITFHGPNLHSFRRLDKRAENFLFDLLMGKETEYSIPNDMEIIKKGKTEGKLIGGNVHLNNSLLGTEYSPSYGKAIWFWEDLGENPASLHQKLYRFKLSKNLNNVSGMIIGHLSGCVDKVYKEDNRPIEEIILEVTKEYNFPIIKVPYFGHDVNNFYTFPIGVTAEIDTKNHKLIIKSPVK